VIRVSTRSILSSYLTQQQIRSSTCTVYIYINYIWLLSTLCKSKSIN
jgi:hypothetical protein